MQLALGAETVKGLTEFGIRDLSLASRFGGHGLDWLGLPLPDLFCHFGYREQRTLTVRVMESYSSSV